MFAPIHAYFQSETKINVIVTQTELFTAICSAMTQLATSRGVIPYLVSVTPWSVWKLLKWRLSNYDTSTKLGWLFRPYRQRQDRAHASEVSFKVVFE